MTDLKKPENLALMPANITIIDEEEEILDKLPSSKILDDLTKDKCVILVTLDDSKYITK